MLYPDPAGQKPEGHDVQCLGMCQRGRVRHRDPMIRGVGWSVRDRFNPLKSGQIDMYDFTDPGWIRRRHDITEVLVNGHNATHHRLSHLQCQQARDGVTRFVNLEHLVTVLVIQFTGATVFAVTTDDRIVKIELTTGTVST